MLADLGHSGGAVSEGPGCLSVLEDGLLVYGSHLSKPESTVAVSSSY